MPYNTQYTTQDQWPVCQRNCSMRYGLGHGRVQVGGKLGRSVSRVNGRAGEWTSKRATQQADE